MEPISNIQQLLAYRANGMLHSNQDMAAIDELLAIHCPDLLDLPRKQKLWHIKNGKADTKAFACACGEMRAFSGKGYKASCKSDTSEVCPEHHVASLIGHHETRSKAAVASARRGPQGKYTPMSDEAKALKQERRNATYRERYGRIGLPVSAEVRAKTTETNLSKYGATTWNGAAEGRAAVSNSMTAFTRQENPNLEHLDFMSDDALLEVYKQNGSNFQRLSPVLGVSTNTLSRAFRDRGLKCNTVSNVSSIEHEIHEMIQSWGITAELSNRSLIAPLELDIVIPDRKLAIEVNGVYWHSFNRSESSSERNRHLNKLEACEAIGYELIQITDLEWVNQKELICSMLKSRVGVSKGKIAARKCEIVQLPAKTSSIFMEENHIQGKCGASIHLGLMFDGEVVAVMTFGKPRYNKHVSWELIRYATKRGVSVVGGGSKLLMSFRRQHPGSIISYSNRMKFSGKMYSLLGFTLEAKNGPGYHYTDLKTMFSRVKFQKHKLASLFGDGYDPSKTEADNCFDNGLRRFWDCGTLVWRMN